MPRRWFGGSFMFPSRGAHVPRRLSPEDAERLLRGPLKTYIDDSLEKMKAGQPIGALNGPSGVHASPNPTNTGILLIVPEEAGEKTYQLLKTLFPHRGIIKRSEQAAGRQAFTITGR